MTQEEKIQLKQAIQEKIEENNQKLVDLREATKPMGLESAIGRVSRMDYINNKAIAEGEIQKAEIKLKALERWLSVYDTDQFGKCSKCGQEININRLLLLPESTRCIRCAGK
jgi:DnaK suppressor protein